MVSDQECRKTASVSRSRTKAVRLSRAEPSEAKCRRVQAAGRYVRTALSASLTLRRAEMVSRLVSRLLIHQGRPPVRSLP